MTSLRRRLIWFVDVPVDYALLFVLIVGWAAGVFVLFRAGGLFAGAIGIALGLPFLLAVWYALDARHEL